MLQGTQSPSYSVYVSCYLVVTIIKNAAVNIFGHTSFSILWIRSFCQILGQRVLFYIKNYFWWSKQRLEDNVDKKGRFAMDTNERSWNPEGEAGAVSPGRDGPLNMVCLVHNFLNLAWCLQAKMARAEQRDQFRHALLRFARGRSYSHSDASFQGDLHMSPLFQVNSSESVLDGWIELVQKREKKESGFKRQSNC